MRKNYISATVCLAIICSSFCRPAYSYGLLTITNIHDTITCDEVYITINNEKTTRNIFIYGETITFNFINVTGLTEVKGNFWPGLKLSVINSSGDTIMKTDDLISDFPDGIAFRPLILTANLTLADPIKSKDEYSVSALIWDKKSKGTFKTKLSLQVKENDYIIAIPSNISYNEIYLFSKDDNKVITDNRIKPDDDIYLIIEGLKGFLESDGKVFPGMSIKLTDSAKDILLTSDDLFSEYINSGVTSSDLTKRVSVHFSLPVAKFNNPLHCDLSLWDRKSHAGIKVSAEMIVH